MPAHLSRRQSLSGLLAGGVVACLPGVAFAQEGEPSAPVPTTAGLVRGRRMRGVVQFLGLPYGADTRARRFLPALPPEKWSGVRDCDRLGPQSPQMNQGVGGNAAAGDRNTPFVKRVIAAGREGMEVGNESEACLVLNLYTPQASRAKKRPVMVWLHGGGFAIGSSGDPQYDGTRLARRGDVVVVTLNHRLNALGYLYLGEIDPRYADSGNAGQLDIVLALQWVRDNIRAFGGDPENVTIFGESGGGSKVSVTLAMPAAAGLFHKAIIQSGPGIRMVEKSVATAHAERTLAKLGLSRSDVDKLQSLDAATILAAAAAAQLPGERAMAPVVDGRALPRHPFDPDAPAQSAKVPLMIGTTKDEAALFTVTDPLFGTMTEDQAKERARASMGPKGPDGIALFKSLRPNDKPTYWLTSLATARGTWINSIRIAERKAAQHAAPVYMFRLDWETPVIGGALKSPHGLDTALVFDNAAAKPLQLGTGPEPGLIAAKMSQAWIDFARTGDPSQPGLAWPTYDEASRRTMIFNVESRVVGDPDHPARVWLSS